MDDILTTREIEIGELIFSGLSNKEIAEELDVTEQTIKNRLMVIYDKLDISNRTEFAVYIYNKEMREERDKDDNS